MKYNDKKYTNLIEKYENGTLKIDDFNSNVVDFYEREQFLLVIEKSNSNLTELSNHISNLDLTSQIHLITHAHKVLEGDQTGTGPYTQIARRDSIAFLSQLTPSKQPKFVPIDDFDKYHVASQAEKKRLKEKAIEIENNKSVLEKCKGFLEKKFGIKPKQNQIRKYSK
jgi:hypothetical protein